jgi:teichuronic acid biosynthesis glycosyltransferase TuaC
VAEVGTSSRREHGDRLRVLVVTRIFPTAIEPEYAPYNRNQLAAVARRADVEILAAIPWFPGAGLLHQASELARADALPGPLASLKERLLRAGRSKAVELSPVPSTWRTAGMDVAHPRVLLLPKMTALHGPLFAASLAGHAAKLRGKVDVVFGSFAYPDGVAAFLIAKALGVPAVMKLHGGDMNVAAKQPAPARWLRFVMPRLARVVAVSQPLADEAIGFGVAPERAVVVENGVEKSLFYPRDRAAARAELGLPVEGMSLLFVGRIERRKGVFELCEALGDPRLSQVRLVWLGEGDESAAIRKLAEPFGDRFTFVGPQPHDGVARHVAACDALVLPSWNEGTPNAVVEALSAGRRVVATRVGGIPAVVTDPRLGELVPVKDPRALADAIARVLDSPYDPAEVAKIGGRHDWDESGARLHEVLRDAAGERGAAS